MQNPVEVHKNWIVGWFNGKKAQSQTTTLLAAAQAAQIREDFNNHVAEETYWISSGT